MNISTEPIQAYYQFFVYSVEVVRRQLFMFNVRCVSQAWSITVVTYLSKDIIKTSLSKVN